jgi:hypothetical protein
LFRRKPRLSSEPLRVPQASEAVIPDPKVLKVWPNELALIIDRARQVSEQLLDTVPQAGHEPPAAKAPPVVVAEAKLSEALATRWWPSNSNLDQLTSIVFERLIRGAAFALIEHDNGQMTTGRIHPLVATAIALQSRGAEPEAFGELAEHVPFRFMFALRAGYYLAREGEGVIVDLVANSD